MSESGSLEENPGHADVPERAQKCVRTAMQSMEPSGTAGRLMRNKAEQYAEQNRPCSAWFRLVPHKGPKKKAAGCAPTPTSDVGAAGAGKTRRVGDHHSGGDGNKVSRPENAEELRCRLRDGLQFF